MGTSLDRDLKADNIQEVIICGVQSEFCIDTTVKSAYSHGYKVVLPKDAHSTYDSDTLSASQITTHHHTILEQFVTLTMVNDLPF
ncbi:isochorismatase family protein [Sporanaerobium hydrogeniformans]|uniref:isochorismatase family protein n=1 Tax=Sporanaerobium hydrogeniformans TaxID=3072179 RepID=UPI0015D4B97B|nr:isochorismatase family protein [Sporanaerobium hydrogeniformans]